MSDKIKVRWAWLKAMYIYTIAGAGGFGLAMIVAPRVMRSVFGASTQDPIVFGVVGSVFLGFGILSILGLRSPLKFAPVLFLQLCYKSIWFVGVILPLLVTAQFPDYALVNVIIFATYIIGDLIAIPFSYIFAKKLEPAPTRG